MMTQDAQAPNPRRILFIQAANELDSSDTERVSIVGVAGGRGQSLVAIKGRLDTIGGRELGR